MSLQRVGVPFNKSVSHTLSNSTHVQNIAHSANEKTKKLKEKNRFALRQGGTSAASKWDTSTNHMMARSIAFLKAKVRHSSQRRRYIHRGHATFRSIFVISGDVTSKRILERLYEARMHTSSPSLTATGADNLFSRISPTCHTGHFRFNFPQIQMIACYQSIVQRGSAQTLHHCSKCLRTLIILIYNKFTLTLKLTLTMT